MGPLTAVFHHELSPLIAHPFLLLCKGLQVLRRESAVLLYFCVYVLYFLFCCFEGIFSKVSQMGVWGRS